MRELRGSESHVKKDEELSLTTKYVSCCTATLDQLCIEECTSCAFSYWLLLVTEGTQPPEAAYEYGETPY